MRRYTCAHAGTPLGDPIEVSALAQALSPKQPVQHTQPQQVHLASVKACYGHTEGAAGLTGFLLAAHSLHGQACTPIMHLGHVNPFVEAALADWARGSTKSAIPSRQLQPAGLAPGQLSGTSSFGMSGVNAHVLLAQNSQPAHVLADSVDKTLQWQKQRLWPLPCLHAALPSVHVSSGLLSFSVLLSQPSTAALLDHHSHGCQCLPAAAWLDLMHAAAATLSEVSMLVDSAFDSAKSCSWSEPVGLSINVQGGTGSISSAEGSHMHTSLAHCSTVKCTSQEPSLPGRPASEAALSWLVAEASSQQHAQLQLPQHATAALALRTCHAMTVCQLEAVLTSTQHSNHIDAATPAACEAFAWLPSRSAGKGRQLTCSSAYLQHSRTHSVQAQTSSSGITASGLQYRRAVTLPQKMVKPAMHLIWKALDLLSTPQELKPERPHWLLLSTGSQSVTLADLVAVDGLPLAALPTCISVHFVRAGLAASAQAQLAADVVVSSDVELERIFRETRADHAFCIQPESVPGN